MPKRLLLLAAVLAAAACKRDAPPPLPACKDDLPRIDVMRLAQVARGGTDPCPNLASPKIVLDDHGVTVDGTSAVAPADLPTRRPENVTKLFQSFEGRRRLWKEIHPGEPFAPTVSFTAAPTADAVAGASVVRSVAWAGFTKFHLVAGDATVDFECRTPRPPGAPEETDVAHVATKGTMHDLAQSIAAELASGKKAISFERGG